MIRIKVLKLDGVEKFIGLIGKKKAEAVYFETRFGIHTFGLIFPIDVVILNDEYQVVKYKKSLQPNKLFVWNPKYSKVLELPKGTIKAKKIKVKLKVDIQLTED